MPRAQSEGTPSSSQTSQLLKRNQACHQCRRRKLRWSVINLSPLHNPNSSSYLDDSDAQKPCSTCVRSHRFAASSDPTLLNTQPECTYDELALDGSPVVKPRSKYKVLEDRIRELEDLLKQQLANEPVLPGDGVASSSTASSLPESTSLETSPNIDQAAIQHTPTSTDTLESQLGVSPGQIDDIHLASNLAIDISGQQLIPSDWPTRLPRPDLLLHLVDVFFNCYPHAHYLLHRPTFRLSLNYSPKSPRFPHKSLLHAICAYAGVFSYLVEPPPTPNLDKVEGDFIFGDRRQAGHIRRDDFFAERHVKWAKEALDEAISMGFNLFECIQALVILTGFYHIQGRWVELWTSTGNVMRCAVPLGLNARPGYRGDGTVRDLACLPDGSADSLLADPLNCVEREQRANLFWIAYANDKFQNGPDSWALSIDDQDVHQVLPCDLFHFEAGYDVEGARQSIESPGVLLQHIPETTDSFSLYIKGAVLVSKTKTFNLRIRHKYSTINDIRELLEFHQIEQQISLFRKSFPQRYHNPIIHSPKGLDIHVYAAHLIPNYAMLLLHEKHVNLYSPNCLSAQKATAAARAILDLVYAVCSTSFDITRLPPVCLLCWYEAGYFLTRIFKLELSRGRYEEALAVDSEIQAIRFAFNQMGTRIPLALRYDKVLDYDIQSKTLQISRGIPQQSLTLHHDDNLRAPKGNLPPSQASVSSPSKVRHSGSGEETPTFANFMGGSAEANLFANNSLFTLGAISNDGSLFQLPNSGSTLTDESDRPSNPDSL